MLGCPFLGLLARKGRLFLESLFFFWSTPVDVSEMLASPAPSQGDVRQNKTLGIYHHAVAWVLRPLTSLPFSLYLLESAYAYFTYKVYRKVELLRLPRSRSLKGCLFFSFLSHATRLVGS